MAPPPLPHSSPLSFSCRQRYRGSIQLRRADLVPLISQYLSTVAHQASWSWSQVGALGAQYPQKDSPQIADCRRSEKQPGDIAVPMSLG